MRGNIEAWNRGDREAYVVTGRDGVPMRTDNFATWAAALEAAGLRE